MVLRSVAGRLAVTCSSSCAAAAATGGSGSTAAWAAAGGCATTSATALLSAVPRSPADLLTAVSAVRTYWTAAAAASPAAAQLLQARSQAQRQPLAASGRQQRQVRAQQSTPALPPGQQGLVDKHLLLDTLDTVGEGRVATTWASDCQPDILYTRGRAGGRLVGGLAAVARRSARKTPRSGVHC